MFSIPRAEITHSHYSAPDVEPEKAHSTIIDSFEVVNHKFDSISRPTCAEPQRGMSLEEYIKLKALLDDLDVPEQKSQPLPEFPVEGVIAKKITFNLQTLLTEEIRDLKENILHIAAKMNATTHEIANNAKQLDINANKIDRITSTTEGILATVAHFEADILQDNAPHLRRGPLTRKRNQTTTKNIHQQSQHDK